MKARERLQATLNHRQPDKVPIDWDATQVTGMHVTCVARLREYYGLEKHPVKMYEPFQMLGKIDEDLKSILGVDVEAVTARSTLFGYENNEWKEYRLDNGLEVLVSKDFNTTKDDEGNTYIYPCGDMSVPPSGKMPKNGFYFDTIIRQPELDEETLDYRDNLEEFEHYTKESIQWYADAVDKANTTGRGVVANFGGSGLGDIALVPAPFLKQPKGIRDVAEWYISTAIRQEHLHKIFDAQIEIAIDNLKSIVPTVKDKVDVVFLCGTDFGTQNGLFCSPQTYKELYMPYYKRINDWIHQNTPWKTFKHTCGAIEPMIPLLIESGFDILNPVQCSAKGMDPRTLKQKYGNDIVFWGGGVDTQQILPFGTPQQVRQQVLERCEIFAKDGGFVFNAIHNIQANTPLENMVAVFEAVKEFNR